MEVHDNLRVQLGKKKRFSWAKFFLIAFLLLFLFVLCLWGYGKLALRPMDKAARQTQALVSEQTKLTNLHHLTVDQRNGTTYAVLGTNPSGQSEVAIVQAGSRKVRTFDQKGALSQAAVVDLVNKRYHPKHLYSANRSYYEHALVWEIAYEDKDGQLNYLTLDYKTGKVYRAINGI
ncbi:hypothetical protein PT274_02280 [Leuconostocaceae bacterium ESL0958]|nr:hypothetical protein [Leuconostocaceae bacterium ESL0958]